MRGGESNYNKVIVDGVTVNEPGGTFDFGTLSLAQGDRMEFVRGAQSTLYGIGRHDQRDSGMDARGEHAGSGTALWRPMEETSEPPADTLR